jgi:hypothetical protein
MVSVSPFGVEANDMLRKCLGAHSSAFLCLRPFWVVRQSVAGEEGLLFLAQLGNDPWVNGIEALHAACIKAII